MTRRDISLTLALCASLTLHAVLLGSAAEWYTRKTRGNIHLAGFARPAVIDRLVIPQSELPDPPADDEDPTNRLGDLAGRGKAIAESPGAALMQARQAPQEQPLLSLDPASGSQVAEEASQSAITPESPAPAKPTDSNPNPAPPQEAAATPVEPHEPQAPPAPALPITSPPLLDPSAIAMGLDHPRNELATPFSSQQPNPVSPPQQREVSSLQSQSQPPAAAHEVNSAANPGQQGSTESDPTSTIGSADFHPGSTNVRLGRKFKLTRPHLTLAGQSDLMTLRTPTIILKITLDETGKVVSADVYRSSGSSNIDQPCQLAAYNWWFEPLKDKAGKPVKDVILFTIHFI